MNPNWRKLLFTAFALFLLVAGPQWGTESFAKAAYFYAGEYDQEKDKDKWGKRDNKDHKEWSKDREKWEKRQEKDRKEWSKRDDKARKEWDKDRRDRYPEGQVNRPGRRSGRENGQVYPYNALRIPPGHLPPPGECRVWYPNRPTGHQPPPQSCATAGNNVPPGAWVITHQGDSYRVNMHNGQSPGVVDQVRYYRLR